MQKILRVAFGVFFVVAGSGLSGSAAAAVDPVSIVVSRPADVSQEKSSENRWLGALAEETVYFRLNTVSGVSVVPRDTLAAYVASYTNPEREVPASEYLNLGRRLQSSFVVSQKYEIEDGGKSVQYYAEVVRIGSNRTVKTIEKRFPPEQIGAQLDSMIVQVLEVVGVPVPKNLERFFRFSVLSDNVKSLRELGDIVLMERYSVADKSLQAAQMYQEVVSNYARMELAYYLGGQAFMRARRYKKAADLFRSLFDIIPEYQPLYLAYARSLRLARKPQEALRVVNLGVSKSPGSLELLQEKAEILTSLEQSAAAQKVYHQILAVDKGNVGALLFLARSSNDAGKPQEALKYAEAVLRRSKDNGKAYLEKGRALRIERKYDEAVLALVVASRYLPQDPYPAIQLGDVYLVTKQYAKAADEFLKGAELLPNEFEVHEKAARAHRLAGDYGRAAKILKTVEGRFSTNTVLQKELGLAELQTGDTLNARRHLELCYGEQKTDPRVLMGMGDIYVGAGQYDDAYKMYNTALPAMKDKNAARVALARLYLLKSAPQQAATYLKTALDTDPNYRNANGYYADARFALGDKDGALGHYERERELFGDNSHLQERIASIYYERRNWSQAGKDYQRLLKLVPQHVAANYRLAVAYLFLKNKDKAREHLTRARDLGKPDKQTFFDLGGGFTHIGLLEKAVGAYQECLAQAPKWEQALVNLSEVLKATKRDKETADVYVRLFDLNNEKYKGSLSGAGHIYFRLGLKPEAKRAYTLFLEKKYGDPEVNAKLAQIEYEAKNHGRVVSLLEGLGGEWATREPSAMALAESYFAMGSHQKAVSELRGVLSRNASNARATELIALGHEKLGDLSEAARMFAALLGFPATDKHREYAFHLGELYEKQGMRKIAEERYSRNISQYPGDIRNFQHLATIHFEAKEWDKCEKTLREAVQLSEVPAGLRRMLARCLVALNKTEEAVSTYQQYLTMAPADSAAWKELGVLFYSRKQYKKAIEPLKMAIKYMPASVECLNMLGRSQFETGEIDGAVVSLKRVLSAQTRNEEVMKLLGHCYRAQKDTAGLVSLLEAWTAVDQTALDQRIELGRLLLVKGNVSQAVKALKEAVKIQSGNPIPHRLLADAYERLGDDNGRLKSLSAVVEHASTDPEAHYQLARYHLERGQPGKAEPSLLKAIEASSVHAQARFEYGKLLQSGGRLEDAYVSYSEAVAIEKANTAYLARLAHVASLLGKVQESLSAAERALEGTTNSVEILYMTSCAYSAAGQTVKAKQLLRDALTISDSCAECHEGLGDAYMVEANYKKAVKSLMRAWELGGYSERVVLKLSRSLSIDGKYAEAGDFLKLILSKNPQNDRAVYELARVLIRPGNLKEARKVIDGYEKKYQRTGWTHLAGGEIFEAKGEIDPAWIAYNVSLRLIPDAPEVQAACGRIYLARRQYGTAVEHFGRAMAKDPNNPYLLVNLAEAYEAQNNTAAALELCLSVSKRMPGNPEPFYVMARIHSKQREHGKALEVAMEGLKHNTTDAKLYYIQGHELRAVGSYEDAVASYEDALEHSSGGFIEAYRHIANTYFENIKDQGKAQDYYAKYVDAGGRNVEAKERLKNLGG